MSERRIDQVRVLVGGQEVLVPWAERDLLVFELRGFDVLAPVLAEFENAGTTRPVVIPDELVSALLTVIDAWAANRREGLGASTELRHALRDRVDGESG